MAAHSSKVYPHTVSKDPCHQPAIECLVQGQCHGNIVKFFQNYLRSLLIRPHCRICKYSFQRAAATYTPGMSAPSPYHMNIYIYTHIYKYSPKYLGFTDGSKIWHQSSQQTTSPSESTILGMDATSGESERASALDRIYAGPMQRTGATPLSSRRPRPQVRACVLLRQDDSARPPNSPTSRSRYQRYLPICAPPSSMLVAFVYLLHPVTAAPPQVHATVV